MQLVKFNNLLKNRILMKILDDKKKYFMMVNILDDLILILKINTKYI
jgi:hypothetical protein